jgi:hypothetical protein
LKRDNLLIKLMREQYEKHICSRLLEINVSAAGGKILIDAGLEVTDIKTGEKFTVQSVQKHSDGDVLISLIHPESVSGPITNQGNHTIVSPGQKPQVYNLEQFEKKFKV